MDLNSPRAAWVQGLCVGHGVLQVTRLPTEFVIQVRTGVIPTGTGPQGIMIMNRRPRNHCANLAFVTLCSTTGIPKINLPRLSEGLFSPLENKRSMWQKCHLASPTPRILAMDRESTKTIPSSSPPGSGPLLPKETLPVTNAPQDPAPHRRDWKRCIRHRISKPSVEVVIVLAVVTILYFFPAALSSLGVSNELTRGTPAMAEDYVGLTDATDWSVLHN